MRIAFIDPTKGFDYVVETPRVKPLGGSQSALCYLAEELSKRGHAVVLYNLTKTPGESRGVKCFNMTQTPLSEYSQYDAVVVLNFGNLAVARQIRSAVGTKTRILLWTQHNPDQPDVRDMSDAGSHGAWDGFIMVSKWQAEFYRQAFGVHPGRMKIIGNAIAPAFENLFAEPGTIAAQKPWPPVLCYTSTPFRGLDVLIEAFPRIRKAFPGATLKVYSSMGVYGVHGVQDPYAPLYAQCRNTEGVEYIGSVSQTVLADELKRATCLAYPNTFAEGYCIAVHEAMAAGCIVITSDLGALRETTAGFAHLLAPPSDKTRHAELYADFAVGVLERARSSPAEHAEWLKNQVCFVHQTETWAVRAREWEEWLSAIVVGAGNVATTIPEALNLAVQHHQAGRLPEAESLYRQILQVQPDHPDALHLLGVIAHHAGRHDAAIDYISRAIGQNPNEALYHNNLGETYRALGRSQEAAASYGRALALKPDYAEAHYSLGVLLMGQGRAEAAIACYQKALAVNPDYAEALNNLGSAFLDQDKAEEAVACYQRALTIKPDFVFAHNNLGNALAGQGKHVEAVAHFRQALALQPACAEVYNNLGNALKLQGQLEEAEASYRQALALQPKYAEACSNLGNVLREQGNWEEAVAVYREALTLPSKNDGIKIKLATVLPVILESCQDVDRIRKNFDEQLTMLLREKLTLSDPVREVGQTNFHLAYHGLNDRELQVKMAHLYERACPSLLYAAPHCLGRRQPGVTGKIKIGFASTYFRNHSIGKMARGLLANLSRDKFFVCAIFVPPVGRDDTATFIRQHADRVLVLPNNLQAARERIAAEELDVLVYQDIGMEPATYFLAFSRLAPVQCVHFGHPVTTGIANLDYFISSERFEPENGADHYSERLVRLKSLGAYYYKPDVPDPLKPRSQFGLDDAEHIYICPQTPFKLHPDFDEILSGILRADPRAKVLLLGGKVTQVTDLLRRRFAKTIRQDVGRMIFLPPQSGPDFINLIAVSDVMLDTVHFGGGFTTNLEAFTVGTPVVTIPGAFQRGRHTMAFYKEMGFMDCVADTPSKYIKIAVRLGTDSAYRQEIKDKILANNHVLYEDMNVIREFEKFFVTAVEVTRDEVMGHP